MIYQSINGRTHWQKGAEDRKEDKYHNDNMDDNTNVESKTRSLVKYVINNIMSTALTGRRENTYVLEFCA